jgi:hypothetical protein
VTVDGGKPLVQLALAPCSHETTGKTAGWLSHGPPQQRACRLGHEFGALNPGVPARSINLGHPSRLRDRFADHVVKACLRETGTNVEDVLRSDVAVTRCRLQVTSRVQPVVHLRRRDDVPDRGRGRSDATFLRYRHRRLHGAEPSAGIRTCRGPRIPAADHLAYRCRTSPCGSRPGGSSPGCWSWCRRGAAVSAGSRSWRSSLPGMSPPSSTRRCCGGWRRSLAAGSASRWLTAESCMSELVTGPAGWGSGSGLGAAGVRGRATMTVPVADTPRCTRTGSDDATGGRPGQAEPREGDGRVDLYAGFCARRPFGRRRRSSI